MHGLLNVHKPGGMTSRDVVNRLQRLARPAKVGHAGTLDPLATGVLVVCLGQATRLTEFVHELPKAYRGVFLLGRTSDTDDIDGEVVELPNAPIPSREEIEAHLPSFLGEICQRPPDYSAIKVQGRRAYDLARRGVKPDLQPRRVRIDAIRLIAWTPPELTLEIDCGSGTYVRSVGRDLAEALGTGAVMSELVRTAIGPFVLENSVPLDQLTRDTLPVHLLPLQMAVSSLPPVTVTIDEATRLIHGLSLQRPRHGFLGPAAACLPDGSLVAVVSPRDADQLRPDKVVFNNSLSADTR